MLRIAKTGLLGLIAVALTALTVILARGAIEAPVPADTAPMIARAADFDVTIKRDEWGLSLIHI